MFKMGFFSYEIILFDSLPEPPIFQYENGPPGAQHSTVASPS